MSIYQPRNLSTDRCNSSGFGFVKILICVHGKFFSGIRPLESMEIFCS